MTCEGKIYIFDKESKRFIRTIECSISEVCLVKQIWGDDKNKGLGIIRTAAKLSGLSVNEINASFNSACVKRS